MAHALEVPRALLRRRRDSDRRMRRLRRRIERLGNDYDLSAICIYATGSYGRRESSAQSDIDLFILDLAPERSRLGNIAQTLLKADLIRACRKQTLPEFSGDGAYLVVHSLDDVIAALGGRADDAENYFTARLLLLLESQPLWNDAAYRTAISRIVNTYFRDYSDHRTNFDPAFLVNDIVRFWKTLCLNYEHGRGMTTAGTTEKYRLKNLKLKFSRFMTCYSALALLAFFERKGTVRPSDVLSLALASPTNRLELLARKDTELRRYVKDVLREYTWFLGRLGESEGSSIRWLTRSINAKDAARHADNYRTAFGQVLYGAGFGRVTGYIAM